MALKDTKFDAFISYRHTELDKFVAETLHKKLEAFRLPASVRRKNKLSKDRIRRVFRDRDELPLASSLAEQITDALQNSEYLIVVCTPRLPQSQWCLKEIDTFIELHGRENIYAILAEGEPSDSFPPQLLYDEKTQINADGVAETVRIPVEPLAADVRGANKKEIRKKMNDELLRLVAPMFGLNYDDLKQRHREQKLKRIVSFSLAISLIFLVFGIFSSVLSLKIQQQADEIYEQNLLISDKNEEITAQATLLQEQNVDLQKSYAVSMALEAEKLIADGRSMDALYALRTAMPDSLSDTAMPYTPQTQKVLTDVLQVYEKGSLFMPQYNYDVHAPVNSMKISPNQERILIQNRNHTLTLWDIEGTTPIKAFQNESDYDANSYAFLNDDIILYESEEGMCVYDCTADTTSVINQQASSVFPIPDSEEFILFCFDSICRTNCKGDIIWEFSIFDYNIIGSNYLTFSPDNSVFFLRGFEDSYLFSTTTGEVLTTITEDLDSSVVFHGSNLYCYATEINPSSSTVFCYDYTTGQRLWNKKYENIYFRDLLLWQPEDIPYLVANSYDLCYTIDINTGEINHSVTTDTMINFISTSANQRLVIITLYDNSNQVLLGDTGESYFPEFLNYNLPTQKIEKIYWTSSKFFYQYSDTPSITCFAPPKTPEGYEEIGTLDIFNTINKAGTIILQTDYDNAYFSYIGEDTPFLTVPLDGKDCLFVADGSEYYMIKDSLQCDIYKFGQDTPSYTITTSDYRSLTYTDLYVAEPQSLDSTTTYKVHLLAELGTVYEFDESEADFLTKDLCLSPANNLYALINKTLGIIDIHDFDNPGTVRTINTDVRSIQYYTFSDDGKYLFVEHGNGNMEIYDAQTGELVITHYDFSAMMKRVEYSESLNAYFLYTTDSTYTSCLNSDLEIIAQLPTLLQYDEQNERLICCDSEILYTLPFFSYEELIKMADEKLGTYKPSDSIRRKHNIN